MPGTDPFQMFASSWVRNGTPQAQLPNDDAPGVNTFGFPVTSNTPIPFWDSPPTSLDPSNQQLPKWDVLELGNNILPGLCLVTGGRERHYDVKPVKGQNFANITSQGYRNGEFRVKHRVWTPQQFQALALLLPVLEPLFYGAPPPASFDAISCYHPALALRGVSSVLIRKIGLLQPVVGSKGIWEEDIDLLEWRKPSKASQTGTVVGSASFVRSSPGTQATAQQLAQPTPPSASPSTTGAQRVPGG